MPFGGDGWAKRYGDQPISQFVGAELIAEQWNLSRAELEEFALRSHRLAAEAQDEGRFEREIAPWNGFAADEGIRRGTTAEQMAALQPPDRRRTPDRGPREPDLGRRGRGAGRLRGRRRALRPRAARAVPRARPSSAATRC